jgi:hypothetical protein
MAKYSDYVKDEIDSEIEDASDQSEQRQEGAAIPERFKGKTVEEVAQSYSELEKLNSRQAQDLGALRRSVDELLALKSPTSDTRAEATSKKPITVDEIYENPDEVIRKVVKEESNERIEQLERELYNGKVEKAMAAFTTRYPTWQDDVKDPAMLNWIKERPYRVRLAQAADQGNIDAADELFGTYYDTQKKVVTEEKKRERKQKVQAAGLESAGAGVPETVERYSRSALMEKRIAAKRGNAEAERWLNAHGDSIQQAYAEGRVVD